MRKLKLLILVFLISANWCAAQQPSIQPLWTISPYKGDIPATDDSDKYLLIKYVVDDNHCLRLWHASGIDSTHFSVQHQYRNPIYEWDSYMSYWGLAPNARSTNLTYIAQTSRNGTFNSTLYAYAIHDTGIEKVWTNSLDAMGRGIYTHDSKLVFSDVQFNFELLTQEPVDTLVYKTITPDVDISAVRTSNEYKFFKLRPSSTYLGSFIATPLGSYPKLFVSTDQSRVMIEDYSNRKLYHLKITSDTIVETHTVPLEEFANCLGFIDSEKYIIAKWRNPIGGQLYMRSASSLTLLDSADGDLMHLSDATLSRSRKKIYATGRRLRPQNIWQATDLYEWDAASLKEKGLVIHHFEPSKECMSSNSTLLGSAQKNDTTIQLWDFATGKFLHSIKHQNPSIRDIWFNSDSIIFLWSNNSLVEHNAYTGQEIRAFSNTDKISSVSPDGNYVCIVPFYEDSLTIIDTRTYESIATIYVNDTFHFSTIKFSANNRYLFISLLHSSRFADTPNQLKIYDIQTKTFVKTLEFNPHYLPETIPLKNDEILGLRFSGHYASIYNIEKDSLYTHESPSLTEFSSDGMFCFEIRNAGFNNYQMVITEMKSGIQTNQPFENSSTYYAPISWFRVSQNQKFLLLKRADSSMTAFSLSTIPGKVTSASSPIIAPVTAKVIKGTIDKLALELTEAAYLRITLHDALGRKLGTLYDEYITDESLTVPINYFGGANGMYFCRIQLGNYQKTVSTIKTD